MGKKAKIAATLGAAAAGVGVGMLFAPKKGCELRKDMSCKFNEIKNGAKKIDKDDVYDYIQERIESIKTELDELNEEKILEPAKEKAKIIQEKIEDLVQFAKKKGNDNLKKATTTLRENAIEISKDIIKKLEKK